MNKNTVKEILNNLSDKDFIEIFRENKTRIKQIEKKEKFFNYVEKYGWPKIIHQFTLKILFLIKNLLKVTLFSVKIL
ncbi:hypothetical protein [Spiroplasma endosymbiont of Amphimallon solstitiale]|uniref:hypothetical protein n=1 Tax=Spiroplasma endosymbiont of Amphimallon solstitiale TaxID=3066288 RepID=UPI00313D56CE